MRFRESNLGKPSTITAPTGHNEDACLMEEMIGHLDPHIGNDIAGALGIKLTHPEKVVFPDTEITKAHLAAYYAAVSERIPHIKDRPL